MSQKIFWSSKEHLSKGLVLKRSQDSVKSFFYVKTFIDKLMKYNLDKWTAKWTEKFQEL